MCQRVLIIFTPLPVFLSPPPPTKYASCAWKKLILMFCWKTFPAVSEVILCSVFFTQRWPVPLEYLAVYFHTTIGQKGSRGAVHSDAQDISLEQNCTDINHDNLFPPIHQHFWLKKQFSPSKHFYSVKMFSLPNDSILPQDHFR